MSITRRRSTEAWLLIVGIIGWLSGCDFGGYHTPPPDGGAPSSNTPSDTGEGGVPTGTASFADAGRVEGSRPSSSLPNADGSCPANLRRCGDRCFDITTDPAHCGTCDRACTSAAHGAPSCADGKCTLSCEKGFSDCDQNPVNGCEPLTTYYQDLDNDGVGGGTALETCFKPNGYAGLGGDCNDGNRDVFPGQMAWFSNPYTTASGKTSYDYNCDGVEQFREVSCSAVACTDATNGLFCVANSPLRCGAELRLCRLEQGGFSYKPTNAIASCH